MGNAKRPAAGPGAGSAFASGFGNFMKPERPVKPLDLTVTEKRGVAVALLKEVTAQREFWARRRDQITAAETVDHIDIVMLRDRFSELEKLESYLTESAQLLAGHV